MEIKQVLSSFIVKFASWLHSGRELENGISPLIFQQGEDPGVGQLRVVGNFGKMGLLWSGRKISFREVYEVMFGKGRSTVIEEFFESKEVDGKVIHERQFKIVGLTEAGRPLMVVFTPRDEFGMAKRVVTAWQVSRKSKEVKKLLRDMPHLSMTLEGRR